MPDTAKSSFSITRVALVALPIMAVTAYVAFSWGRSLKQQANVELERSVVANMLAQVRPVDASAPGAESFADADGDLVPDPAADATLPDEFVFSYIARQTEEGESPDLANWEELAEAVSDAIGRPVKVTHFQTVGDQLAALRAGEVHLVGLSTGAVPLAVSSSGVVPLCSVAQAVTESEYNMVILTGAKSSVKEIADLKGRDVVFVRPTSNSGFKAAFLALHEEANLLPERDYRWSFSLSHEGSALAAIRGDAAAAPVASDILDGMVEDGRVARGDYRIIYESEAFPRAAIGCTHQLPAETISILRKTLTGLDWAGTGLERELGPSGAERFVAVDYKDDWALIRRINAGVASLAD